MTEVIFSFDTEDYTNPGSDESILRLAEVLHSEGIRASFNMVGSLAEALVFRGRRDVIDALRHHEINYHSYRHSWHPTPVEYSDRADWESPYKRLVEEEAPGIEVVKRVFQRERLYAAIPPGNCVTAQALYAYPEMDLPLCVSSFPFRNTGGRTIYYCGGVFVENNSFWDSLILTEGIEGIRSRIAEWRKWERLVICMHPNLVYYPVFWDKLNLDGANLVEWGQWRLAERRDPQVIEQFFTDFREAVRMLKRDPHFTFSTFQPIVDNLPVRKNLSKTDLPGLLETVRGKFFFAGNNGGSTSLAEMLGACAYFLSGEEDLCPPVKMRGPTSEPQGIKESLWVDAGLLRQAAARLVKSETVPAQVQVGDHLIGPRDFMEAARQVLRGEPQAMVHPQSQSPEIAGFYHLDQAHLAGTWLYSPEFKDEWVTRHLKWQAWTIHL